MVLLGLSLLHFLVGVHGRGGVADGGEHISMSFPRYRRDERPHAAPRNVREILLIKKPGVKGRKQRMAWGVQGQERTILSFPRMMNHHAQSHHPQRSSYR